MSLFGCLYGLLVRLVQAHFVQILWLAGNAHIERSHGARLHLALPPAPLTSHRGPPLISRGVQRAHLARRPGATSRVPSGAELEPPAAAR